MAEGNTKGEQTMTRLIDADALKEYFKTIRKYHVGKYSEWYLADVLEQQPTIDAEPVRHGKWIGYAGTIGNECSVCGKWIDVLQGTAEMNY
jgi:hypothetical protein